MGKQILKIKVKKNVGLIVSYNYEDKKGVMHRVNGEKISADPTKEFATALSGCRASLIKSSPMGAFEHALLSDQMSEHISTKDRAEVINKSLKSVAKGLDLSAISLKYNDGEINGVTLTGTFTNHQGDVVAINSPYIQLDQNTYGWEANLLKKLDTICEHAQNYLKGEYVKIEVVDEELEEVDEPVAEETEEVEEGESPMRLVRKAS